MEAEPVEKEREGRSEESGDEEGQRNACMPIVCVCLCGCVCVLEYVSVCACVSEREREEGWGRQGVLPLAASCPISYIGMAAGRT